LEYLPFKRTERGIRISEEVFGESVMVYQFEYYLQVKKLNLEKRLSLRIILFTQPCSPPFIRNWHNHFDNYGNYMPGYCAGISLGNSQNLDRLLKEAVDLNKPPVLKFLINQDFVGLFKFAKDYGYQELQEGYVSKCYLSLDIRKYLVAEKEFEELKPREFFAHLD